MFSGQCLHFWSAPPYLECTACLSAIALRQIVPFVLRGQTIAVLLTFRAGSEVYT